MVEKMKKFTTKCFSNGPKAKIIIGGVIMCVVAVATLTMTSMRKTLVLNLDGENETFVTYKGTVKDVLQEKGIVLGTKDKVQPSLETKVSEKEQITLKKAIPVEVTFNGVTAEVYTSEDTVSEMLEHEKDTLKDQGIEVNTKVDEVSPALDTKITENLKVKIVKVETKDLVEKEPINFETVVEKDDNLDSSIEKIKSEGVAGEKETTYQVLYKDGVEISRNVKSTKTISEPQNKIVVKGTGTFYASRSGESIKYQKKLVCEATAYTGHSNTATGTRPVRVEGGISTIAVDPSVIPLGSKVYIEGYGYAIAADTGGAIKGNKIDLYLNSDSACTSWGRQSVTLLVVAYPGEY